MNNSYVIFEEKADMKSFSYDRLRNYLNNLELKEESIDNNIDYFKFVMFRYITSNDIKITHKYYKVPIFCINILEKTNCITDKYQLYNNMNKYFPEHIDNFMPKSFKLTIDTQYNSKDGDIFITRPVNNLKTKLRSASGQDIYIYNNEETLEKAKQNLNKFDNVIVSKYITNPLLFHGKKFHFRAYMIVTVLNGLYTSHMLDICRIFTSKNKFINDDYQNKKIHDTHYRYNDDDYIFPNHFTTENLNKVINENDIQKILDDIKLICFKMAFIFSKSVKLMSNTKNGFHLFGFDIMLDENLNPILLECNRFQGTGLDHSQEMKTLFENKFFDWMNDIILKPLFTPDIKVIQTFSSMPIYQIKL